MAVHVLDQLAAETRQNKQRIINAHSQADHHGQGCGVLIDAVGQARCCVNAQRAKHYAHNRRGQRHSRRHQRSERDQQHHGRHENTHQLALHARLLCAVKCVARVGNVKAIRVVFQQFSNVRYLIFINILHFRCIKHHLDNPRRLIRAQRRLLVHVRAVGVALPHRRVRCHRIHDHIFALQRIRMLQLIDDRVNFHRLLRVAEGALFRLDHNHAGWSCDFIF